MRRPKHKFRYGGLDAFIDIGGGRMVEVHDVCAEPLMPSGRKFSPHPDDFWTHMCKAENGAGFFMHPTDTYRAGPTRWDEERNAWVMMLVLIWPPEGPMNFEHSPDQEL